MMEGLAAFMTLGVPSGLNRSVLLLASYFLTDLLYCSVLSFIMFNCSFFWLLVIQIQKTQIALRKIAPIKAFFMAILGPALMARAPPVMAPEAILFRLSSLFRMYRRVHSDIEQIPPHMAKLPELIAISTCQDGRSFLHHHDASVKLLALGREVHTSAEVPDSSHETSHGETSTEIVHNSIRAWLFTHHGCKLVRLIIISVDQSHPWILIIFMSRPLTKFGNPSIRHKSISRRRTKAASSIKQNIAGKFGRIE